MHVYIYIPIHYTHKYTPRAFTVYMYKLRQGSWKEVMMIVCLSLHSETKTKQLLHACIHVYMHTWIHTYIHTYVLHTCVRACMHPYIHTCTHAHIQKYCLHTYTHTCMHACIHTGCPMKIQYFCHESSRKPKP